MPDHAAVHGMLYCAPAKADGDCRPTMQTHDSMRRRSLFAVFVVSGFTGLIYESIWSHYLKLFLGHAAYAQTLVLAIFMGGMALGSWSLLHQRRGQPRLPLPL